MKKLIGKDIAAAYKVTDKSKRSDLRNVARAKGKTAFADASPQDQMAAGKLMKLNEAQLAHMLAIASSLSAGIRVNFGSMSKPLNAARASENGVFAAELASQGFTGGDFGLDGQWGFFQVLGHGAGLAGDAD